MPILTSTKLSIYVDCLEFCPFSSCENLLACGLYQLREETQNRIGGIQILKLNQENNNDSTATISFQDDGFLRIDTCGILALRWITNEKLIGVCSDGRLRFFKFENSQISIDSTLSISNDKSTILLCLEIDADQKSYLIGDNKGNISIGFLNDSNKLDTWNGHDQSEVWCVDFHRGDQNLLFSGGDDSLLKGWDRRTDPMSGSRPIYSLTHDAGVTSIYSTNRSEFIWSGSYDDHLRFWDLRNTKNALKSINLGGGVWRIRPKEQYLLCACMYNGWCIVEFDGNAENGHEYEKRRESDLRIKYEDNTNGSALLYGIDWVPGRVDRIVCSTFYDYTVHVCAVGK